MKLLPLALSLLTLITIPFQPLAGQSIGKSELILTQQDHQLDFHPQNGTLILTDQRGFQEVLVDSSYMYEMVSPFRNHLHFDDQGDKIDMSLTHSFSDHPDSQHSYEMKIVQLLAMRKGK